MKSGAEKANDIGVIELLEGFDFRLKAKSKDGIGSPLVLQTFDSRLAIRVVDAFSEVNNPDCAPTQLAFDLPFSESSTDHPVVLYR